VEAVEPTCYTIVAEDELGPRYDAACETDILRPLEVLVSRSYADHRALARPAINA
jgi:hypothetical protein